METRGRKRKWKAQDKLRIVLLCMQPGVEVSEVCRREGINPTQFYTWKKKVVGAAGRIFEEREGKESVETQRLRTENDRMKSVIAEITAENLEIKKGRWA